MVNNADSSPIIESLSQVLEKVDCCEAKMEAKVDEANAKMEAKVDEANAKIEAKVDEANAKMEAKFDVFVGLNGE